MQQLLWSADEVLRPGNLNIATTESGDVRLLAIDDWRFILEMDLQGRILQRQELPIGENAAVTFLRLAKGPSGESWRLAGGITQQHWHLFDHQWQTLLSHPEQEHAGTADVQLLDINRDGVPEVVTGYWEQQGVECVDIRGNLLWSNQRLSDVMRVAGSSSHDRGAESLWCVHRGGSVAVVSPSGELEREITLPSRRIMQLVTSDLTGDGTLERCAIAEDPSRPGTRLALGLDSEGREMWHYPLPAGDHSTLVERIVPGRLSDREGGWILPGPDGSIHLLTWDGTPVDHFRYGEAITGLALAPWEGRPLLVIATATSLKAWTLRHKPDRPDKDREESSDLRPASLPEPQS